MSISNVVTFHSSDRTYVRIVLYLRPTQPAATSLPGPESRNKKSICLVNNPDHLLLSIYLHTYLNAEDCHRTATPDTCRSTLHPASSFKFPLRPQHIPSIGIVLPIPVGLNLANTYGPFTTADVRTM